MAEEQPVDLQEQSASDKTALSRRLDQVGWGLFFIWVGIAVLADVGWDVGLLGVGVLALAEQGIRKSLKLKVEWFWVVVGVLLVVGGGWDYLEHRQSLMAGALIVVGVIVVLTSFRGKD